MINLTKRNVTGSPFSHAKHLYLQHTDRLCFVGYQEQSASRALLIFSLVHKLRHSKLTSVEIEEEKNPIDRFHLAAGRDSISVEKPEKPRFLNHLPGRSITKAGCMCGICDREIHQTARQSKITKGRKQTTLALCRK